MKKTGIIGVTYEATALFYRKLCDRSQKRSGSRNNPDILLHTPVFSRFFEESDSREKLWAAIMLESIERLAEAGCDFVVCPANSNHIVYEALKQKTPIPWISIVETVQNAAFEKGLSRLGLMGTDFTLKNKLYSSGDLDILEPESQAQDILHREITEYLVFGKIRREARELLGKTASSLKARGAEGLILGCTELTLFAGELESPDFPVLDSTSLLVERTLKEAMD